MAFGAGGLIGSGFFQGAAKGMEPAVDYTVKSTLADEAAKVQAQRDATLQAFQQGNIRLQAQLGEQADINKETRKRAQYSDAETRAKGLIDSAGAPATPNDDNGNPNPSVALSEADKSRLRQQGYRESGLPDVALQMEGHAITREEAAATRAQQVKLAEMTDSRIRDEAKLNRDQQLQLHQERMEEMRNQFKNQGLELTSTKQGVFVVNKREGTSTPLKDENGKPLETLREDDSLKMIGAIGNLAKASADAGDMKSAKMYIEMANAALTPKMPAGTALPMPKDQKALRSGTVYQTARGPAKWNGTAFESVK